MNAETQDWQTVLARVDALEKQNQRLRIGGAIGGLALVAALLVGFAPQQEQIVTARGFILVDTAGAKRAELVMHENCPALRLFRPPGDVSVGLADSKLGPILLLKDAENAMTILATVGLNTVSRRNGTQRTVTVMSDYAQTGRAVIEVEDGRTKTRLYP